VKIVMQPYAMFAANPSYTFGPVPSRRLGKSLGINNIPPKVCTYSCVYCQVGRTTRMQVDRRSFFDPEKIVREVKTRLAKAQESGEGVDYLTFVPDGEPTLDADLGRGIALLKPLNLPIGVITNGTLLWRKDVREDLSRADWVSVKADAVETRCWHKINRPHNSLKLAIILEGMCAFAKQFKGKLATETLLVNGVNERSERIRETADFVGRLKPEKAYLSIPTRPPAEKWVKSPSAACLNQAYLTFAEKIPRVEYLIGDEGNAFGFTGDVEKDILSITAVHPMKKAAVEILLSRAGAAWKLMDRLVEQGRLEAVEYQGDLFFLRKFN